MNNRRRKKLTGRLMGAVLRREAAAVRTLLRMGADPNAPDRHGTTPLYEASVNGAAEIAGVLLQAGAAPDTESGRGHEGTPLCAGAAWGYDEVVRVLLAHGADANLREDGGSGPSPLEWALRGGHVSTAELLRAAAAYLVS